MLVKLVMEFCYGCYELVRRNFCLEFLDNSVINCGFIVFVKTVSLVRNNQFEKNSVRNIDVGI